MKTAVTGWTILLTACLSSVALGSDEANCKLYAGKDMQGIGKELVANDMEGSAPSLVTPLTGSIGSIWVKDGFALETYDKQAFTGTLTTWSNTGDGTHYTSFEGGAYINLADETPAPRVASYRCRALGEALKDLGINPYATLHAFSEVRLSWVSGGNHPNHKWVEITEKEGARTLLVHEDNTYGINRVDYVLDLDKGTIKVTVNRSARFCQEDTLTLPSRDASLTVRLTYAGALWNMIAAVDTVAAGNDLGYVVLPPKPELNEVRTFLRNMVQRLAD